MNRVTKGAIALGAATALLLGGAGSIAYWSASATTTASEFTMGDLRIEPLHGGAWFDGAGDLVTLGSFRPIPGTQLEFVRAFAVTAVGDGLLVQATFEDVVLEYADGGMDAPAFTVELRAADDLVVEEGAGLWRVTGSGTVEAVATLTVPESETGRQVTALTAGIGTLLLQQVTGFDN